MKKLLLSATAIFFLGILSLHAQTKVIISYPIGFPIGKFQDYISNTAYRGISLEINKIVMPELEVGIETTYNGFYQKETSKVYTDGTRSISGVQFRYTNAVPLLAQAKVYAAHKEGKSITPYAGLGVGTIYIDRYTDFGLYRIVNDSWQFCLKPELGISFAAKHAPAINIGVKYYAGFKNSDLEAQSYITLNVGVGIPSF